MKKIQPLFTVFVLLAFAAGLLACSLSDLMPSSDEGAPTSPSAAGATLAPTKAPAATKAGAIVPTAIPGWKKFTGPGLEIWLPNSFDGGDPSKDMEVIISKLKALGPEYESMAKSIEQNPGAISVMAYDSQVTSAGVLTNVNVAQEKVLSAVTLDVYMDAVSKQLPSSFKITDRKKVQLDAYEAGLLEIDVSMGSAVLKELVYMIKVSNTMYAVTYTTSKADLETKRPIFAQSINTFRATP